MMLAEPPRFQANVPGTIIILCVAVRLAGLTVEEISLIAAPYLQLKMVQVYYRIMERLSNSRTIE